MPRPRPGVLVCDAYWRKTLVAIRALGRAGERVVAAERTASAPGFFSRHARARVVTPSPARAPEAFIDSLLDAARRHACDVVLAGEEDTCATLLRFRSRLDPGLRLCLGPAGGFFSLSDKSRLPELAAAAGVPIPATRCPKSGEEAGRMAAAEGARPGGAGWRIKPRRGSGGRGQRRAAGAATAGAIWESVHEISPGPILQEEVPPGGPTLGASVLIDESGALLAGFAHRRLREYPVEGGSSTLRESVAAPELIESAARLCRAAGWAGLAMAEFKQDPRTGTFFLLEVNPRLWGSLDCAIEAGVNFPALAVRWARGDPPAPVPPYRPGVRTRWLLPGDLLHGAARLARGEWPADLFRPHGTRSLDEMLDADDPRPAFALVPALAALWGVPEWRERGDRLVRGRG
ncbi:MAG: ATP-grasp domain-containing protein [Planctomycetes bacterium]|nr:ATP-grasp domain-containing protein [Planctomycetota bacterium]